MKIVSIGRLFVLGLIILGAVVLLSSIAIITSTSTIDTAWHDFKETQSEKIRALNKLQSELGYGGMIHHFKNFVLRGDEERSRLVYFKLGSAKSAISSYQSLVISTRETEALQNIEATLDNYYSALLKTKDLRNRGASSSEIDHAVEVDDTPALEGLKFLSDELNTSNHREHTSKARLINNLRRAIGYGGMIHNFKNYILRHGENYEVSAQKNLVAAQNILNQYLELNNTAGEQESIQVLINTFKEYREVLNKAKNKIEEGFSVNEIDKLVLVDDKPALNALDILNFEINNQINLQAQVVTKTLRSMSFTGVFFVILGLSLIIALIALSLWLIKKRITGPISILTQAMVKLTHNDLRIDLQEVEQGNEIGDMARAVKAFKENIIARKVSDNNLRESEEKYRGLLENSADGILLVNKQGRIENANQQALALTGYAKGELVNQMVEMLIPERFTFHVQKREGYIAKPRSRLMGEQQDIFIQCKDGSELPVDISLSSLSIGDELSVSVSIRDITQRKQTDEILKHSAHFDLLTNLPNRVLLADRLSHAMVQCQRRNQSLAVAYMDLDGFKVVNDTYGHELGDKLLVEVSKRMKEALREGDTLARIGGDEFIVVMVDLDNIEDKKPVLERLLKAAAKPVTLGDAVMQVSASIGVTLYPQDGADADQLMRHADHAMYIAKQAGKNRYHLFDAAQNNAINIQRQSIDDVRSAMERCEFVLHYQPKVNMHTGDVIGVEALIRWQHPDRGLVPPLDFLPAIEGHAISLELGEWVIGTALIQISQWRGMDVNLPISVNISGYQLQQDNFVTRLEGLLAAHPEVDPHCLELEILETSVLNDISQVSATMAECDDQGVRFALDDFGTGYSSLTHLRRLPAHLIKIDQSFVRDMLEDTEDLAIVEGVVALAKSFKRDVIAEGVETIAHGVALLELGCELAQGYGIARPMPAADIPEWLSNWKADDSWQAHETVQKSVSALL